MINIENTVTPSSEQWKAIIMGMRNPMNSWDKSDSEVIFYGDPDKHLDELSDGDYDFWIGPNDKKLMTNLAKGGSDDRKFMRMIAVYADITAPLYWWKEFDTYKVGTVTNSCSTMHKIHAKEFTLEDFSCEHLYDGWTTEGDGKAVPNSMDILRSTINILNQYREIYLATKEKRYWWQMIQLLPSSYNQKRTVMLNYEVLRNMYNARRNHKLDEWHIFCDWIERLPYSELITLKKPSLEFADQPGLQFGA